MKPITKNYPFIRFLLFVIVGLMNTVFIRPERVGSWQHYVGFILLALAAFDGILFLVKRKKQRDEKL